MMLKATIITHRARQMMKGISHAEEGIAATVVEDHTAQPHACIMLTY